MLLLPLAGCGGCRQDEKSEAEKEAERLAKEEEEKRPEFDFGSLLAQPSDPSGDKEVNVLCWYKPGHWTSTLLAAKANKNDFLGELSFEVTRRVESTVDAREPVPLPGVPYTMTQFREVALPKGQPKLLQGTLFVPPTQERASAMMRFAARRGSRGAVEAPMLLSRMPAHQYHFVVLARTPVRYQYLKGLDSVRPPSGEMGGNQQDRAYYQVALLRPGSKVALPSESLYWTSIAYVLWDDFEPQSLSVDQRTAMLDWLHWGGQLIVSGPDTVQTLRGTFLADYLPAESAGPWELVESDFDGLNARFAQSGRPRLKPSGPWTGVKLNLARQAQFVPGTGKLLAERRVGRGRVVLSAVRLSDRSLTTWAGFDDFVNACLLRRPPRQWHDDPQGDPRLDWSEAGQDRHDAALVCQLRFFSRDTGVPLAEYTGGFVPKESFLSAGPGLPMGGDGRSLAAEERATTGPGVAGWQDFGPVPASAREALRDAASVEVPGRWFVIWVVAAYLVVLVPLNWLVFTALGRVEWAWAAAPLVAIACTVFVIHLAQLDIGFARSETQVGVLELQPGYARGHLTRYVALYTSLGTHYSVAHEDPGSIVQPFPEVDRPGDFELLPGQRRGELRYDHGGEPSLAGLLVASNSTDSVHAEQMVTLEGPLEMLCDSRGRWQVLNRTGVPLMGVGVLGRAENGQLQTAWVGEVSSLGSALLSFSPTKDAKGPWWPDEREADVTTATAPTKGRCNLRKLMDLAEDASGLRPGEYRLVGWTDQILPGLAIRPAAPQAQSALLVVAHLGHALPEPPRPDVNTKDQIVKGQQRSAGEASDPNGTVP